MAKTKCMTISRLHVIAKHRVWVQETQHLPLYCIFASVMFNSGPMASLLPLP